MYCLKYFVFIIVLVSIAHLGLSFGTALIDSKEDGDVYEENNHDSPSPAVLETITTTTTIDSVVEEILDNSTDTDTAITTTTTIINDKPLKQFLTEYPLDVNLTSISLVDIVIKKHLSDLIILNFEENQIILINKTTGAIQNHFKDSHIISINQPLKETELLAIFDDNTQELWIFNGSHQQNQVISFKPKAIYISPSTPDVWIAETTDEIALYVSQNAGVEWKKIDQTSSSAVLGWPNKENAIVISQHSRYIKLLDTITYQMITISSDVSSAKLFSRYLMAKQSNTNNSFLTTHVNHLTDGNLRPLPKRLQSQGNFYCAVEDINTQDLLLLSITDNRLEENNETVLSTCNLISYSKQNLFNLSNINCASINGENSLNTIECSKGQLPFYQVRGLSKNVFLANVGTEPLTVISFDGGVTWNRTHYECNEIISCPNNVSLLLDSLVSSNDVPGILIGKASDGINKYVAVSSNGGQFWLLSFKGDNGLTAMSNPDALIVTIPNRNIQSPSYPFRYSTDYGRNWHLETFSNQTSVQILSLIADKNNVFYILTADNENQLKLIQLDFNLRSMDRCVRNQVKEWSLSNSCINGSKLYYKRRLSGSHCLNDASQVRPESCSCSLSDFECLPGFKRSKDGVCLPRSQHTLLHDCTCSNNNTLLTKRRGYMKSAKSQCKNGIENYLSDAYLPRRDADRPSFFIYGTSSITQQALVDIYTNDFDQDDDDEDEEEEEVSTQRTTWFIDEAYGITALVFDEYGKQVYMAVEHEHSAIIYRIRKNLHQQDRATKRLLFDSNNELYKSMDESIQHLTFDRSTQNLYVLFQNKNTLKQGVFILDTRTYKRRTIVPNQLIQPSILLVDPIKTNLYWISHSSPSKLVIADLQGQIKTQIRLLPTDASVSYMSYDPITHEVIFVIDSTIYGLNTLENGQRNLSPRVIYEHSSTIQDALFSHPILYFTNEINDTDSSIIYLNSIDILAKSFAKNIAKLKNFNSVKLLIDMAPIVALDSTATINRCENKPCSDICIPLEHGRFRCLCSDDARYPSCSCPSDERFSTGSCQARNKKCAPGRVLCQNGVNCAESARVCEQDHTQYTEAFKDTARCTIEKPNDGFDCYYADTDSSDQNNTCIPFEWLCDGAYDCPFGNDEEHCHKLTTTTESATKIPNRCLIDKRFTHILCQDKCMRINSVCSNASNALACSESFHLNCKQTQDKSEYVCKCYDDRNRCIAMIESCDDYEHCEQVCRDSIHYAISKLNDSKKISSTSWKIIIIVILLIILFAIILMTFRYIGRRKAAKSQGQSRTPAAPIATTANSTSNDAREQLLNQTSNTANGTN